jgi:hypothetical protein
LQEQQQLPPLWLQQLLRLVQLSSQHTFLFLLPNRDR